MSQDNVTAETAAAGFTKDPTAKETMFFYQILTSTKNKLEVDWELVAQKAGYANASTASVRYGQIKKRLGLTSDGSSLAAPKSATPKKPRVKKEVGSGANKTPSKVTKPRTPKKTSTTKAVEAQFSSGLADDDEMLKFEEHATDYENVGYENQGGNENDYYDENEYYNTNEVDGEHTA